MSCSKHNFFILKYVLVMDNPTISQKKNKNILLKLWRGTKILMTHLGIFVSVTFDDVKSTRRSHRDSFGRSPLSCFGCSMFLVSQCGPENCTKRNVRAPLLWRRATESSIEIYSVFTLQTDFKCRIT